MTERLPDIGHKPRIHLDAAGDVARIGWPTALVYVPSEGPDAGKELPWPPTTESHPGKPQPIPLDSHDTAKKIADGTLKPLPRSVAYLIVEKDREAVHTLAATGWLQDKRHKGDESTIQDNRSAPHG